MSGSSFIVAVNALTLKGARLPGTSNNGDPATARTEVRDEEMEPEHNQEHKP
jgi:hypothetical protein